jgi:Uncharacterized conserved protein (DUF2358)
MSVRVIGRNLVNETQLQDRIESIVQTLQQDLPTLFERDITYDIYTSDIHFRDPVNRFKGKFNYRIVFWTLRFHGQLFFTDLHFDLHQVYPAADRTIVAEWTVRGTLRLPWRPQLYFNGSSTYQLTPDGLIYDHVDTWDRSPGEILGQFWKPGVEPDRGLDRPDE